MRSSGAFNMFVCAACFVAVAVAHTQLLIPKTRYFADGSDLNFQSPCGGGNVTGMNNATAANFLIRGGNVTARFGDRLVGEAFVRYWKGTDIPADPSAWVQIGYLNITANPPSTRSILTDITAALGDAAKVGDIGVIQVYAVGSAETPYQCADVVLVAESAASVVSSSLMLAAAAAIVAVFASRI